MGEETPVVRVSAVGAPIHASLQASIIRTLTPGGVDQVGPVPQAEERTVITGVSVTPDTPEQDGEAEAPAEPGSPAGLLRLCGDGLAGILPAARPAGLIGRVARLGGPSAEVHGPPVIPGPPAPRSGCAEPCAARNR